VRREGRSEGADARSSGAGLERGDCQISVVRLLKFEGAARLGRPLRLLLVKIMQT